MFDSAFYKQYVTSNSPQLVLTGEAGTGKSQFLRNRVSFLANKPDINKVLYIANPCETSAFQKESKDTVWAGTFSTVADRILRLYGSATGIRPQYTVLQREDCIEILDQIQSKHTVQTATTRPISTPSLLEIYFRAIHSQLSITQTIHRFFPQAATHQEFVKQISKHYVSRKKDQNILDQSDLLLHWSVLLETPIKEAFRCIFQHVVIDNYEDSTALQNNIVKKMTSIGIDLTVVGSFQQNVFRFSGNTANHLQELVSEEETVHLETQKFTRFKKPLSETIPHLLRGIQHPRSNKYTDLSLDGVTFLPFPDEYQQSKEITQHILETAQKGLPYADQAILFRSGYLADAMESALIKNGIPFTKHGAVKPAEISHQRELLSLLRILENPADEQAWRILFTHISGIDPRELELLLDRLRVRKGTTALTRFIHGVGQVSGEANKQINKIRNTLLRCCIEEKAFQEELADLIQLCEDVYLGKYENSVARKSDLQRIQKTAQHMDTRNQLLTRLAVDPPERPGERSEHYKQDGNNLSLSTIHAAKGKNWRNVYLIHASDDEFPAPLATSDLEIEEERRLLYTAMSRASERITVSYCDGSSPSRGSDRTPISRFFEPFSDAIQKLNDPEEDPLPPLIDLSEVGAQTKIREFFDSLWHS